MHFYNPLSVDEYDSEKYFKKNKYDVVDIDGARVTFDDGWGLVRASNTQPVLVLRFEATSEKRRDEIRSLIEGELNRVLEMNKKKT